MLRYYGREGLAHIIRDQVAMAREFRARIAGDARFEICRPEPLSRRLLPAERFRRSEPRAARRINGEGRFFLSHTVLNGRFVLRVAVGNILTTRETLDGLWQRIVAE